MILTSLNYPGVSRVLREVEKVGYGKYIEFQGSLPKDDSYLFGGWSPLYFRAIENIPSNAKVGVIWTSTLAQ